MWRFWIIKGVTHAHLGAIWNHSEPSDIPYSPSQFLGWDFFCRFLQQDSSKQIADLRSFDIIRVKSFPLTQKSQNPELSNLVLVGIKVSMEDSILLNLFCQVGNQRKDLICQSKFHNIWWLALMRVIPSLLVGKHQNLMPLRDHSYIT